MVCNISGQGLAVTTCPHVIMHVIDKTEAMQCQKLMQNELQP